MGTLLVLAVHGSAVFINLGGSGAEPQTAALQAWRFVVSYEFGRQGVIGFFVMSGFLVGGAVIDRLKGDKPFLLDYCVHRFARIYLVLVPAILLTIVLDNLGRTAFSPTAGAYGTPFLQEHYNPIYILTDLLNLQGVLVKFYGTNGPLWSIAYEFWYYFFFPLLLLPLSKAYSPTARKLVAAFVAAVCIAVSIRQIWFPFGFLVWGLGAALCVMQRPLIRSPWLALALDAGVILVLRIVFDGPLLEQNPALLYVSDAVSALAFANLILTLRFASMDKLGFLEWPIHKRLADFSFTVYAIHAPLLMFLRAAASHILGEDWLADPSTPTQWRLLATAMGVTLAFGFLLSLVTEAKVGAARRALNRFFARVDASRTDASAALTLASVEPERPVDAGDDCEKQEPRAHEKLRAGSTPVR